MGIGSASGQSARPKSASSGCTGGMRRVGHTEAHFIGMYLGYMTIGGASASAVAAGCVRTGIEYTQILISEIQNLLY